MGVLKECTACHKDKPLTDFYQHKTGANGRRGECKECVNSKMFIYSRERYASIEGRSKQMFNSAKCRAKKRGLTFTIHRDQIHLALLIGICQKTGIKFDLSPPMRGQTNPFTPSLDRKDARFGYETGNVQIVCNMFNMGKSDHDELDFIAMCMAVAEYNSSNEAAIERLKGLRNAGL